ncbi:FAD-dependent oxidoreductase [Angustibacter sp. Root456]|uniref:FAD-dependent oxidoreductase n=1 Tax=Angustibacter sp. Root456 TaxID=1736539 RepID=UPI0006F566F1|nr:GMC family oxidoreductase [Angustibacter sp. Root456]KQX65983.1 cholesterol oxidase [Angustibacter sp. Root456]
MRHPVEERLDHDVDQDVVVIGSGFGGSVSALRLAEKGYDVLVLEAGRRFADDELAKTSWDLRRFLWAPRLGCFGVQRIHRLPDVVLLAGAGVGGGSLNYANTLYVPPKPFFDDPQWAAITDWADELTPHYDQATRMLGVVTNPCEGPVEEVMRAVADEMGVGHTFAKTPVGVFFGEPGRRVPDPYFGGAGPDRTGCTQCGNCMVGCRVGAKNTLVKNYLALAEGLGVRVEPLRTVVDVRPLDPADPAAGWAVTTERTGAWARKDRRTTTARDVVLAAGTWGTQRLLHRMRAEGVLPRLSSRLGVLTRTNSEALLGAMTHHVPEIDLTRGVAITSSFFPQPDTHVENCRYGKGSNAMGLLATILVDGGGRVPRWVKFLGRAVRHPEVFARSLSARSFSERTIIGLVMQTVDNSITVSPRRHRLLGRLGFSRVGLTSGQGHGNPNPTWIPAGHDAVRRLARRLEERTGQRAEAGGALGDLGNVPMTAHFLGGCVISDSPDRGVVDAYHRVHGYPGLHVVDGSTISANLGVNPSLTITAQAERAMSLWPNRGDADPRPAPGAPYERVAAVPPRTPAVPASAPGALRWASAPAAQQ